MRLDTWVNSAKGRVAADLCKQAFNIENGFFFFWPGRVACRILVPQPGTEPVPPAVEAQSLNQWTTREFPRMAFSLSYSTPPSYTPKVDMKRERILCVNFKEDSQTLSFWIHADLVLSKVSAIQSIFLVL